MRYSNLSTPNWSDLSLCISGEEADSGSLIDRNDSIPSMLAHAYERSLTTKFKYPTPPARERRTVAMLRDVARDLKQWENGANVLDVHDNPRLSAPSGMF